ncbi:MAG: hypothetical protein ACKV2T_39395 [Kofleriaceae bacterium]
MRRLPLISHLILAAHCLEESTEGKPTGVKVEVNAGLNVNVAVKRVKVGVNVKVNNESAAL